MKNRLVFILLQGTKIEKIRKNQMEAKAMISLKSKKTCEKYTKIAKIYTKKGKVLHKTRKHVNILTDLFKT